jgi:hypothetical protein
MSKRQPTNALTVSERDGQVSARGGMQSFFLRNMPMWNPPVWQEAEYWRRFVELQPIAAICRDRIADHLNSLDWTIAARDSEKRDELKGQIKHYTKLFERGNAYWWDIDLSTQIEWFVKDLFTLPFGTASELGRLDDNPYKKVVWIRPLDGGTLAPTLNFEFPVCQNAVGDALGQVFLPRKFVSRVYLSPRTEIRREGWGYAPPERIQRAIFMVSTGDNYYAKLLLDTPEAGILDLMDMDSTSAKSWVEGFRDLFYGISPLKIPVLYEHEKEAKWIPFGKPPSEIMYDSVTMKYATILCAGYGLTLSDIGFGSSSNGGETLAGTIRMERVGKASGKSTAKKRWEIYANQILPDTLQWQWIDYDDEKNVSKGRARLATAQAGNIFINNRSFKPSEIRRQAIADGLFSIDLPEDIDENDPEFQSLQKPAFGGSNTKTLGSNKTQPSQGGQGEVIPQQIVQRNMASAEVGIAKATYEVNNILPDLISKVKSNLSEEELPVWEEYVDDYLVGKADIEEKVLKDVLDDIEKRAVSVLKSQKWIDEFACAITERAIASVSASEGSKKNIGLEETAQAEFVEGNDEALEKLALTISSVIDLSGHYENLHSVIFESLVSQFAKYIVLVSKSQIISGKLEVDPSERVGENIRVSREIGKEVLQNLSRVVNSVYQIGCSYLERTIENAGS